ncbi:MAG: hypothetical protein IJP54_04425, partial [Synergistaceae bacterium]|nr:hypothetical protein [Synergistaceae bacterium]
VMLMDGTIDGTRPALRIVPDVSNDGTSDYNAEYIVIRDGKTDNKWNMTFFLAPRDYVVNPDVPIDIDIPVIANTGGSGGGGCEMGIGISALAVIFMLRKLERR